MTSSIRRIIEADSAADFNACSFTTSGSTFPESGWFTHFKASLAEGGHRVPTFVTWPDGDIPAGKVSPALWGLHDLFGSFAHMLGYKLKDDEAEDTWDVMDAILGKDSLSRRPVMTNHNDNGFLVKSAGAVAFRTPRWKLAYDGTYAKQGNANNPVALFDMKNNPKIEKLGDNTVNLINKAEHKALIDSLKVIAKKYYDDGRSRPLQ